MSRAGDIRNHPQRPGLEPEIIPPGAYDPRADLAGRSPEAGQAETGRAEASGVFISIDRDGVMRQRTFRPPGPLAVALMLFVFFGLAATLALLAFGFVLIWVPIALAIVGGAMAMSFWRRLAGSRP